ncbi:MAG: hypothetical protein ABEJ95_06985 [Candidatus Nanohalobium sp.]
MPNPQLDHAVWELTVEKKDVNHRVFLDIEAGTLIVLAVWSFEFTHSGDSTVRNFRKGSEIKKIGLLYFLRNPVVV